MQRQTRRWLVAAMLLAASPACVLEQGPAPGPGTGCEGSKCDQPLPSEDGRTDFEQVRYQQAPSPPAPPDTDAIEACTLECDGEYGQHGVSGESFCLCRTGDFGAPCQSHSDCGGECLFDAFEPTDESGEVGVAVGTCSEFETEFGCVARLPDWIAEQGPQPIPFDVPIVCVH